MVRKGRWDHLRCIKVPDVCPMEALNPDAQLSMAAGAPWRGSRRSQSFFQEFVEVYKTQATPFESCFKHLLSEESAWDGMATCFFLDTAKNVFLGYRL